MKALYLEKISGNPERLQEKNSQTVMGAKVFEWNLLCALLEHGTYDAYLSPGVTEEGKRQLVEEGLSAGNVDRLSPAPLGSALPVQDSDQVVLLTPGRHLDVLANLRSKIQKYRAPICGFIHSINSARFVFTLLQQCFVGLFKADLLLCSSRAGMQTIDMYIEEIERLLPAGMRYPARRALVPLGVSIPKVEQDGGNALRLRLGLKAADCLALYCGRLSQSSKCDLGPLLVALSLLLQRGAELHLVIAGDDTQTQEAPRLLVLAKELGCQKNVTIWPNPSVAEKHLLYSEADIFVSPSDNIQETFGLTVAEAMAYGLPCVVSDWDGYRDLVRNGENGFLVPSIFPTHIEELRLCDSTISMLQEDALAQSTAIDVGILSESLEQLAANPALRRRFGQAARRYVENNCSWRVVIRRYEELWQESLEAAQTADSSGKAAAHNLLVSPLEKYFGHYAKAKRDEGTKCFMTEEGQKWLQRPGRLYFLSQISSVPCPQQFADMLRDIAERPGLSVADVVKSSLNGSYGNGTDSASVSNAHWTLARLFKYGLVSNKQLRSRSHDWDTSKGDGHRIRRSFLR